MSAPALPCNKVLRPGPIDGLSVKVIGLGGVGGIVARYAAVFLAAQGGECRLVLIDGDAFEASNATRMIFGAGGNKAAVVRDELLPRFIDSGLSLVAVEEFITPDNTDRLIREGDVILLAVDNHATRKLVSDHCSRLDDVCLISGGNDGVGADSSGQSQRGTYGNVQLAVRMGGRQITPPLTHHHPEIESPADSLPTDASCTELIASVPQILFTNLAVASAILNTFWLHLCDSAHYGELALDIADGLMRPVNPLPTVIGLGEVVA